MPGALPDSPRRREYRLYDLVRLLRDGSVHRAADLARRLGVSERTIYRDMDLLAASGVAVEGTRGSGYRATAPVTLPPLNLSLAELEALHLGLAVVGEAGDARLRGAAETLAARIDAALGEDPAQTGLAPPAFASAASGARHVVAIRAALRARQKLRLTDRTGADRTVRPLRLDHWARLWTLTAWCETRGDFDVIRLEQIAALAVLPALFVDEAGKTLHDLAARGA